MANYLPVLVASTNANVPSDDSSVSTLPRSQVDYLSHQWKEDDIAKSWRSMTRQKNEITNGIRLENASWRTWWKQRNKLKTVSPETLNWLKDSDVTWLYGPLHTSVDWAPPPKPKPQPTSVDDPTKSSEAGGKLDLAIDLPLKRKSILKQRTISEMLTSDFTSPPLAPGGESDAEDNLNNALSNPDRHRVSRPGLPHTKSDSHVTRWGPDRTLRKDSPPRVDAPGQTDDSVAPTEALAQDSESALTGRQGDAAGSQPRTRRKRTKVSPPSSDDGSKKKHISFNTFVEQCIAIDKPKDEIFSANTYNTPWGPRKGSFSAGNWLRPGAMPKEWLDGSEDEEFGSAPIWTQLGSAIETDSESSALSSSEDDDEADVRMRPNVKSAFSSSSSSSSSGASRAQSTASSVRHSADSPHVTIAPIAPTRLKTNEEPLLPKPINWSENLGDDSAAYGDDGYVYGGIRRNPSLRRHDSDETTPVELVFAPPLGSGYSGGLEPEIIESPPVISPPEDVFHPLPRSQSANDLQSLPVAQAQPLPPTVVKTAPATYDLVEEDAYDYFGGPDMDIEFSRRTPVTGRTKPSTGSTPASEPSTEPAQPPRTPSPRNASSSSNPIPVPDSSASLLSPREGDRGRPLRSTSRSPTGSTSSHSRGRSSTRTSSSSLSNERSSPLGSLSPDGIGSPGGAYANGRRKGGRERDRESERSRGRSSSRDSGDSDQRRGRDRTSRSLSHSRSPSIGCSPVPGSQSQSLDAAVVAAQGSSISPVSESQVSTPTQDYPIPKSANATPTRSPVLEKIGKEPTTPANSPLVGNMLPPYIQQVPDKIRSSSPKASSPTSRSGITKSKPVASHHQRRASKAVISTSTTPPSRSPEPPSTESRQIFAHGPNGAHAVLVKDKEVEDGVVGRAVGLVNSAGMYLGFWNGAVAERT